MNDNINVLSSHGVRPTAVRLLIYDALTRYRDTFSMADVEMSLETVDKSTIFRTLTLFSEQHLLHEIEDGSGSTKYCLCHNGDHCSIELQHCHFYCEVCRKTYCLDRSHIPPVAAPDGFTVRQIDYLMKGVCENCRPPE